MTLLIPIVVY